MTATTVTADRPATRCDGFGSLLYAEWTKFWTVRGWATAMVIAALLTAGIGIWAASGSHGQPCGRILPDGQVVGGACASPPLGPGGEMVTDSFYFVRQPLSGNGTITARVTALAGASSAQTQGAPVVLQPWAKAGIIVKASLRQGSAYAAMMVTGGHGARMQYDYTRDIAGRPGRVSAAAPRWLRLARSGDTLTGYDSADGRHWTLVGTARLARLPAVVLAGVFVASPTAVAAQSTSPTLALASFDHLGLTGARPGAAWRGSQVGGARQPVASGGFTPAPGGLAVHGSGDIAPAVANSGGSKAADGGLTGLFIGLIVVTVVGTMFITGEYRRGLIHTTLAASPRRGQVLAAKAIVIGLVTFVIGLVAAAIAVALGQHLLYADGNYVLPMSWVTGLRVAAGSAALLALAAVLALALGTILRRGAGPVTAVIALLVVPYFFTSPMAVLPAGATAWLLRVTPAAGFAAEQALTRYPQVANSYTPEYGYYPLPPWAGLAVLAAWTALALTLALVLLRRRDA
jgi:ABC-type transport system involved in multi-copper enzyme maturation permease subunit